MPIDYLTQIKDYNIRKEIPSIANTVLLVIDMQYRFKEVAEPIIPNVTTLMKSCKSKGIQIIYTRHGYKDSAGEAGMMKKWWGNLTKYGTQEWQIFEKLKPQNDASVIDKETYNAFFRTDLSERLEASGVNSIIICGVMTNCCCETTAREAFVRDYDVFFVADATQTINEELHLASLRNLAYGFAYIVDTKSMCHMLSTSNINKKSDSIA
jgi:isochorismate hydrolase